MQSPCTQFQMFGLALVLLLVSACGAFGSDEQNAELQASEAARLLDERPDWLFSAIDVCPVDVATQRETPSDGYESKCWMSIDDCVRDCKNGDGLSCYAAAIDLQLEFPLLVATAVYKGVRIWRQVGLHQSRSRYTISQ